VDTLHYHFQQPTRETTESLARVTLDVNSRKINIFTTHLRSFKFGDEDYDNIAALKRPEENKDRLLQAGKGILSKFRQAYRIRYLQADQVREQLDLSDYPTIITGDFNDVPNSYTYFTIKGDFQDAFVKKSWGLGRTFFFISPTLRIDYVLTDKNFEVLQYKRDLVPYSDHYPVITDISLKEGG
jgi:endonuclease/exonuclease/phosphatase family metal-dependent hydrolase